MAAETVDEPLAESALQMRRWAAACCPASAASCEAYHGLWPYLRLMGLDWTLGGHGPLFLRHTAEWARDHLARGGARPARVLVSGSADYSMLAHVLQATREAGLPVAVTVVDQCETPLRMSQWYAQREGFQDLTLAHAEVFGFRPAQPFDLIITSSFFGYFTPGQRLALFQRYADMFAPGGWLVFSNRLRPSPEDQTVGFSESQAEALVERVRALAPDLPPAVRLPTEELADLARGYTRLVRSYPINSPQTVRDLAQASGLEVMRLDGLHNVAAQAGVSGPTTTDTSPYVFAVLRRPAA